MEQSVVETAIDIEEAYRHGQLDSGWLQVVLRKLANRSAEYGRKHPDGP